MCLFGRHYPEQTDRFAGLWKDADKGYPDQLCEQCELCIGFCDVCLYHQKNNLITETEFNDFFLGLLNLVAEENRKLFREVAKKKYCSNEIVGKA